MRAAVYYNMRLRAVSHTLFLFLFHVFLEEIKFLLFPLFSIQKATLKMDNYWHKYH